MVCSKCGIIIKEGCVFCSNCGEEAQIVSEIHILEDDLLRQIIDEEDSSVEEEGLPELSDVQAVNPLFSETKDLDRDVKNTDYIESEHDQNRDDLDESSQKRITEKNKKKKKKLRALIALLIILLALLAAGTVVFVRYRQMNSVDYLMEKAENAYMTKDYKDAQEYLNRVIDLENDNMRAVLLLGEIDVILKDYDTAESLLLYVLSKEPYNVDAYTYILKLYDAQNQTDKIYALMESVDDADILELFKKYTLPMPVFDLESGDYDDPIEVKITAMNRTFEIYYTLDGKTPTIQDNLYLDPIQIKEEGKTTLKAICKDKNGKISSVASAEYNIRLLIPDMPKASPDGGQFSRPTSITLTVPEGATAYYTWDGTVPTEKSFKYRDSIAVPEGNNVLSVVAISEGGKASEILKCNYIYYPNAGSSEHSGEQATEVAGEADSEIPSEIIMNADDIIEIPQ